MDQEVRPKNKWDNIQELAIWQIKGFLYSVWNKKFYQKATKKRVIVAVVFLFLFASFQSVVATIKFGITLVGTKNVITNAFEMGNIPDIEIKDGIATTFPSKPFELSDDGSYFAIDTTGKIQEINRLQYYEGILITKNQIIGLMEGEEIVEDLSILHEDFGNPIVINQEIVSNLWNKFTLIALFASLLFFIFWYSIIKLALLALFGVLIWGIISIKINDIGFEKILITGIYANVPAVYLVWVFGFLKVKSFWLFIILLLFFWGIFIYEILKKEGKTLVENPSE